MNGKKFFYLMSVFTALILTFIIIITFATSNTGIDKKMSAAVHYNMSKNLYQKRQYKEATEELSKALVLNDKDSWIFLELGKNYIRLGKSDEATKYLKKSINLNHKNVEAYIALAQIYNGKTNYDDTIKLLNNLKLIENSTLLSLLGEAQYRNNKIADAEKTLKKVVSINSHIAKNYNLLGLIYLKQDKTSVAITMFRKATSIDKTFIEARCNLAKALWLSNKPNYAVIELEDSINDNANYPETYYLLGKIYAQNNLYQKVNDNFIKIFQIDNTAIPQKMIADIAKELESIAPKSQSASVYNTLAIAYTKLNQNNKAIKAYKNAINRNIKDSLIYNNLASLYFQNNNIGKAVYYYKQAITLSPNESVYYYDLGNCYKKLKNYQAAIDNYNKSLELNPSLNIARVTLGDIYKDKGDLNTAKNFYNQAIQRNISEPYAYLGLSNIAEKQENQAQAAKYKSLYLKYVSGKKLI